MPLVLGLKIPRGVTSVSIQVHPYPPKKSIATILLDNGNVLKTVQALMGGSHIRTTEAYLHSTDGRKLDAIRTLQFGA
jgi:site-specific recombinase XerD